MTLVADPTWADVFVAVVAGMAFVLSIVGLVLQWVTWRHSGPRVQVTASQSFIVWAAPDPQHVLSITARNRGRAATQVTQWWLQPVKRSNGSLLGRKRWMPAGDHIVFPTQLAGSAPLPTTLDQSSSLGWMVDWRAVENMINKYGVTAVRPWIGLGSGVEIKGKSVLVIAEESAN